MVITSIPSAIALSQRKIGAISIATVAATIALYVLYDKVARAPRSIRHIPQINVLKLLKALLWTRMPIRKIVEQVTMPSVEQGLYTRFDENGWCVHITDPEIAKRFLLKTDLFPKTQFSENREGTLMGRLMTGPNIVFLNDQHEWRKQRMIANPAFRRSLPVELFGQLTLKLFETMDKAGTATLDVPDLMQRLTLDAIGKAGFGFDFNSISEPDNEWVQRYNSFCHGLFHPLFFVFPALDSRFLWLFPDRQKRHQDLTEFMNMLNDVIVHKRRVLKENKDALNQIKDHEKDLLTLLLEESESVTEDAKLSNEELQSNLCIFFMAGHDTTANALSFAIYYMARHPEIQEKARAEALSVLSDDPIDVLPTAEQTKQMPYIDMVIKEALRANPPVPALIPRLVTQDIELKGTFIPKGTRVNIDIYGLHHNPRIWKDPFVFRPERFEKDGEADKFSGTGMPWVPFSNGARQCIGMNFSLVEQRVFLPMLLRKYEWRLPEDSNHKDHLITVPMGIITPKDLKITFSKRY